MDSIQLNRFSLEILDRNNRPVEKVIYKDSNYFALPNGVEYKLRLTNDHGANTDAHVWIDGEKVGVWRLRPYSKVVVERPTSVTRRFTILKEGTNGAREAGIRSGRSDNGLVRVTFKPELNDHMWDLGARDYPMYLNGSLENTNVIVPKCRAYSDTITPYNRDHRRCSLKSENYDNRTSLQLTPAGTGLGRDSDQRFRTVTPLSDIDYDNITTIYARLVVDNDKSAYRRNYLSLREANNVSSVPPRIDLAHPRRPHKCNVGGSFKLSDKYYFDNF